MDVITADIGNSNISLGLFRDEELEQVEHIAATDAPGLVKALQSLQALCPKTPDEAQTIPVIACSVNPAALQLLEKAVSDTFDQRLFAIGRDIPLDIKLALEDPDTVGTDRLVTAAAAYDMLTNAVVIADFGTATTVDCVRENGIFVGGAIMPGLRTAALSLHEQTAALPVVDLEIPPGDFGANTTTAIQHGIYYGTIGAVRGLVERYASDLGRWPHVILTGGYAELIAKNCDFADSVVPNLCLTGIYLAYVKWQAVSDADFEETS
jgi:type III pantothenate kinase